MAVIQDQKPNSKSFQALLLLEALHELQMWLHLSKAFPGPLRARLLRSSTTLSGGAFRSHFRPHLHSCHYHPHENRYLGCRIRGCNSLILRLFAFVCVCSRFRACTCVFGPFSEPEICVCLCLRALVCIRKHPLLLHPFLRHPEIHVEFLTIFWHMCIRAGQFEFANQDKSFMYVCNCICYQMISWERNSVCAFNSNRSCSEFLTYMYGTYVLNSGAKTKMRMYFSVGIVFRDGRTS